MSQELNVGRLRVLRAQVESLLAATERLKADETIAPEDALYRETCTIIDQAGALLDGAGYEGIVPEKPLPRKGAYNRQFLPVQDVITALALLNGGITQVLKAIDEASIDISAEMDALKAKLSEAETRSLTILDDELRDRCLDLLVRPGKADTAVREAGVVLENRIRKKAELPDKLVGVGLVDSALSPGKGVLSFPGTESERQGIHQLYRGTISFFRNPVSHRLIEDYDATRARQVVGFVDLLLQLLREAELKKSALKGDASPTA